jgi:hypothetical protein
MSIIYGYSRADTNLLKKYSEVVNKQSEEYSINQINKLFDKYKTEIDQEKNIYLENYSYELEKLENKIIKEKEKIIEVVDDINEKLNVIKYQTNKYLKAILFLRKVYLKEYFKPKKIKQSKKLQEKLQNQLTELKDNPQTVFMDRQQDLVNNIKLLEEIKLDPNYKKAISEIKVLEELQKLDGDSHVLCGLSINLKKNNLKKNKVKMINSDFIVINKKGVFLINIKSPTNTENIEIVQKTLLFFFKSKFSNKDVAMTESRIKNILIELENKSFESEKKSFTYVTKLDKINYIINNNEDCLLNTEVSSIVYLLRDYITLK